ncbi:efflux RND transporter permease subunit [Halovenus sp. HT40]|uniref:efflux RND transporter permease subunit n=1 Tax=Halovenus sp. HT40 TaxID=3126691 RepID=UPI00300EDCE6
MSDLPQRFADFLTTYSKTVIVVMLLLTAGIGAGAGMVEQDSDTGQFESESDATEANEYIQNNFVVEDRENQTTVQLIQRGENVLTEEALIESLELQQEFRDSETINGTLADENAIFGVENLVAQAQLQREARARQRAAADQPDGGSAQQDREQNQSAPQPPTLDEQIAAIERIEDSEWTLEALLTEDPGLLRDNGNSQGLALMPRDYEPGTATASARLTFITQRTDGGSLESPDGLGERITNSQLEMRDITQEQDFEYTVFGAGIITEEIDQSLGDSGAIVGPLALLFVVLALTVAYRDLLDIILGVVGIFAVLIWTFGFMGWTGVAFNQLLLSVPVLLIGLSIDYAIHVFMRHREQRAEGGEDEDLRRSMGLALGGVGVALIWVTATAAIGFLANLTSPIGPLRDFGVVSAFGVTAALLIFGALIPALKIEIDGFLEAHGLDRQKRAFGTGDSRFSRVLASGAMAARRFPVAVVAVTLLLTLGGAVGATQVDTSFQQEDFLADSPPEWTQDLPEPFKPGEYQAKEDIEYLSANFQQEGSEGEILIRGNVTDERTLQWVDDANADLSERETIFKLANGEPDIRSPLSVMQRTAAENPQSEFAANFAAAAGAENPSPREMATLVPEENVSALYDQVLELNPRASQVIYQSSNGEYEALRMTVAVEGDASGSAVASDLQGAADEIESNSENELTAIATGDQVIFNEVEQDLLSTVIQGLIITLVAVFVFLAIAYRLTGNPASLGVVTLLPVVFSVSWILGSMWLLGISFNTLTGTITSLTIGLGIAYSIHISSRYELELRRQGNVWDAMETTVTGTGGALLGSAATTVGGFGTLVFAILPVLRQFGIITGLTIIYAFLASVLILPSLLVLWTRYLGPSGYFPDEGAESSDGPPAAEETTAADSGTD